MCGIIGIFNQEKAFDKLKTALALLKNRGQDGFGLSDGRDAFHSPDLDILPRLNSKNLIGHTLHSLVEYLPRPINKKGILVANCEIYNWHELAKKYGFNSKNDTELILDLLDKFGLKKILLSWKKLQRL